MSSLNMDELRGEWVWVIGGGLIQLLAVQEAKARGYSVLVTDRDLLSQGAIMADAAVELDTYDSAGHVALAKSLPSKPKAVLTYGADVGPTVSAVARELRLRAAKPEVANQVRNKALMRAALAHARLVSPAYLVVRRGEALEKLHERWVKAYEQMAYVGRDPYPCVVKPVDNCGSRGVGLIQGQYDWAGPLDQAFAYSKGSPYVLVEEYVPGDEYATDWLIEDGVAHHVMSSYRVYNRQLRLGVELGGVVPWSPNSAIRDLARKAALALGVEGPFKMDLIMTRRGAMIGECATRQSGGLDQYVWPHISGARPVAVALNWALGLPFERELVVPLTPELYGCHLAPVFKPGRITGWDGIKEARRCDGAIDVYVRELAEIQPLRNGADRPLFVAACGLSREEAIARAAVMGSMIRPHYVEEANAQVRADNGASPV